MKNSKTFNELFKEGFLKTFGFLSSDYNFSFDDNPDPVYTGRNNVCEVTISWDRPMLIIVSIKPPYHYKSSIDVQRIAHYFEPRHDREIKIIKTEDMEKEMVRLATLLKKYCIPMMIGDFSEWYKIWDYYNSNKKQNA